MNSLTSARPTKALIYCRVSGKKQTKDGSGLDSQEYRCRQYAEAKGYDIEAVFPDDVSGGGDFINRKGMVALLAYLDARPDERYVVIFDDLKRYSRDTEFHLKLRREMSARGAVRECLNFNFEDSPEGQFNEIISVAAGELERLQMGRQNKQKAMARVEQGYAVKSVPPIGLKYVPAKGGGKVLVHDEPLASIVREALEGFASGRFQSQSEVKRFLEAQPEFPKDFPDGRIRQMRVKRMLEQIMYGGYVAAPAWGISMRDAKHEGIVSKETFWRIQDRLKGRPVMAARKDMNADFPLRGAITCSCCGYTLTGGWSKGKCKHYAYYFCHHQGCDQRGKTIPVAKLHGRFEEVLKALRPSKFSLGLVMTLFAKAWDDQTARLAETTKLYATKARELEAEIDKVVDRMIEVTNPRALKAFEDRIETLERDKLQALEKARKKPAPTRPFAEMFELSLRFLANPYDCWEKCGPDARNIVIRLAFDGPLNYTRETAYLNTEKSNVFRMLESFCTSRERVVPPGRLELPLPKKTDFESSSHSPFFWTRTGIWYRFQTGAET
ncbi:recombinase family protein [Hwanghaeella sp. LZ110]|uniref:recombinase family protein n=1 Tax=Hwanghaeella sp. LZ110 TaxID=3402810 RepID=UPI003B66E667